MDEQGLWSSPNLPAVPPAAIDLLGLVKNPRIETDHVVRIARSDRRLCELILGAANSLHFGFRSEVKSIERAIPMLGFNVVVSLAVGLSLMDCRRNLRTSSDAGHRIWQRCLLQASACELIHKQLTQKNDPEAFYAGLLLDVGLLGFAQVAPAEFLRIATNRQLSDAEMLEQELVSFGTTHVEFGTKLAQSWRVPRRLVDCIAVHHTNSTLLDPMATSLQQSALLSSLIGELYYSEQRTATRLRINQFSQRLLKFTPVETLSMLNDIAFQYADTAAMFGCQADGVQALTEFDPESEQPSTLSNLVFSDQLTEFYDRPFFDELLRRECLRSQRTGAAIGLFAFRVGDSVQGEALRQIAHAVAHVVRNCDAVSRYQHRTFVAMLHEPSEPAVNRLRQRIHAKLDSLDNQNCELNCSWTIVTSPTLESKPYEHLTRWLAQLEGSSAPA